MRHDEQLRQDALAGRILVPVDQPHLDLDPLAACADCGHGGARCSQMVERVERFGCMSSISYTCRERGPCATRALARAVSP